MLFNKKLFLFLQKNSRPEFSVRAVLIYDFFSFKHTLSTLFSSGGGNFQIVYALMKEGAYGIRRLRKRGKY